MRLSSPLLSFAFAVIARHRALHASAFTSVPTAFIKSSRLSSPSQWHERPLSFVGAWGSSGAFSAFSVLSALPTVDEVGTDDFMRQLGHASQIIPLLHPHHSDEINSFQAHSETTAESNMDIANVLKRQLSHSDGIRGFFAVYLTSAECLHSLEKGEEVPPVLVEAVRGADRATMVPLACMNVIMPTAMKSSHVDPDLRECAAKTARNGIKILQLLKGTDEVLNNARAIMSVCGGVDYAVDGKLIEYWEKFFKNYKYEQKQKEDIALAIVEFC